MSHPTFNQKDPAMKPAMHKRFALIVAMVSAIAVTSCRDDSSAQNSPASDTEILVSPQQKQLIVQCESACASVADFVTSVGGEVTVNYDNVDALAVSLPSAQLAVLERRSDVRAITKDVRADKPKPISPLRLPANDLQAISSIGSDLPTAISALPANYDFNHTLTGVEALHKNNQFGEGVVVGVIDTGCANNPEKVASLAGSIIGGENFVPIPDEPSATSTLNDSHGTMAASLIAGHGSLVLDNTSELLTAIKRYAPESVTAVNDTQSSVPMIGVAPKASVYCLKVAGATEDGFPTSRIISAMDRALTLKRNFDAGGSTTPVSGDGTEENPFVYDALNIQVVNLSLGGPTLYAAREVEDLLVLEMLKQGIVVTVAAGNEGPAAMTGGSPGTSIGALTVGAASEAKHERVLREVQLGTDQGELFRPTSHVQTADFSSRGPTADGRNDPDMLANGVATLVQAADGDVALVSGTSFSSPTTAGAAALLTKAVATASAIQVRNSLIKSANPTLLGDKSTIIDQGAGFLDIPKALTLLEGGTVDNTPPSFADATSSVKTNIERLGIEVLRIGNDDDNLQSKKVTLVPGEVRHFFVQTDRRTKDLRLRIRDVNPALPKDQQNKIFGDDLIITVVDAPTSFNHTRVADIITGSTTFDIPAPQIGLVRIAVMGDWTNAGPISANVIIEATTAKPRTATFSGTLEDEEIDQFNIRVKEDTKRLELTLDWGANWASYPSHDLDLILVNPKNEFIFDAATLDSPERLVISNPMLGKWTVLVEGFLLHGFEDSYRLNVKTRESDD